MIEVFAKLAQGDELALLMFDLVEQERERLIAERAVKDSQSRRQSRTEIELESKARRLEALGQNLQQRGQVKSALLAWRRADGLWARLDVYTEKIK